VLDGVNRQEACLTVGVEPVYTSFQGDYAAAVTFVISANLTRRHLDTGKRALIANNLTGMKHGGDRKSDQAAKLQTRKAAAAALNVSERSVSDASVVQDHGAPELIEAVKDGSIPVSVAADLAHAPPEEQRKAVKSIERDAKGKVTPAGKKAIKQKAKTAKASAGSKRKGKPVPKVKTAASGKATEPAAPNAKAFKEAAAAFASSAEYLFSQKAMAIIEHPKLPAEQRNLVSSHLLHIIKRAKELHAKLEGTRNP
jgi:hypothetical protein